MSRRFPSLWTAEETDACSIVRDANGQAVAYVYFEDQPGRRSAARLLARDEARRIAPNVAKLRNCRNGHMTISPRRRPALSLRASASLIEINTDIQWGTKALLARQGR